MKRTLLFLATNAAVLMVLSVVFRIFGIEQWLYQNGTDINLQGLLMFSALFGMGGSLISLALSKWMAKNTMGVAVIEQPADAQQQWLVTTIQRLSGKAGIGMPEVGIFQSESPNAFATGMHRDQALVAVSSGLLQRMPRDQVEAVLGHEITHVANGDMVTLGLLQGVINTFVIFLARLVGLAVDRVIFRDDRGMGIGYFITTLVAQMFLSFLASFIVMAFSRWREYRADAGGARLAGRSPMIGALRTLQRLQNAEPLPGNLVWCFIQIDDDSVTLSG
ncbi:MAG: protease HtpX [Candidatus Thiodiazotropha sp.]|jgi:heat shock protein HtpX